MNSKSVEAYRLIRQHIVTGKFLPGDRLVLAQLAMEFKMSVVPVREAIRRLEAEGILEYERNVGARVAHINKKEYRNIMEALAIIEAAATSLAAPLITKERIAGARKINAQIAETLNDFDAQVFAKLNHDFHEKLYEACPNPYVREMVSEGWEKLAMVRDPATTFTAQRAKDSVAEHERLINLIAEKTDPMIIEAAVREHRLKSLKAGL